MWGSEVISPYKQYNGSLPQTLYLGRTGLETLLRRLVLGGDYKNIRQVIGTVVGISRDVSDSHFIDRVTVRTPEGAMTDISAALVVGTAPPCLYVSFLANPVYFRLYWTCCRRSEMASEGGVRYQRNICKKMSYHSTN